MAERFNAPDLKSGVGASSPGVQIPLPPLCRRANTDVSYFVYVLRSTAHERLYIGSTATPDQRLESHNAGRVRSTKAFRPWSRVLLESHADRQSAEKRERYLKSGWGRRELKGILASPIV